MDGSRSRSTGGSDSTCRMRATPWMRFGARHSSSPTMRAFPRGGASVKLRDDLDDGCGIDYWALHVLAENVDDVLR